MRVVLDCNVLVSAARTDGTCREVIDRAVRRHEVVLSEPILSEYRAIAGRRRQAPSASVAVGDMICGKVRPRTA